ncbi:WD40 repeat-like protein [Leucogyrophana mollusca]|uniref:WD40 repeat-like protein n=1 Tax=Leucogyrophana mollusca TaxID=85980 RepID=A0ACB8AZ87_9AGAM|nr:WD40 repeat-like protein [Leucogyrophana mollusca]
MSSPDESSSLVERTSHALTKVTTVFKGHTDSVMSVAHFPDGRHIASGSSDKTIRIWNIESGKQQGEASQHHSAVKAIAMAPDGGKIAGRVVGGLIVWDVVRQKRLREVETDSNSEQSAYALMVAFSPDGRCIATASSASNSIQLWDVDTGSPVREIEQHVDRVWCLSFSPDGARIATRSAEGSFQVLDISTGKTVVGPAYSHNGVVNSLVYSPNGRLLITASDDSTIRAWNTATGREVGRPMLVPRSLIQCIAISADGKRIASASSDPRVRLWNLETRLQVGDSFAGRPSDWKHSVAFSPNGRFVISGGTQDVYLWDTVTVLDSAPSPPTTSNRESSRSDVPSAHLTTDPSPPVLHETQTPLMAHRDTSSLSSSILDLPAVLQPIPERVKVSEHRVCTTGIRSNHTRTYRDSARTPGRTHRPEHSAFREPMDSYDTSALATFAVAQTSCPSTNGALASRGTSDAPRTS